MQLDRLSYVDMIALLDQKDGHVVKDDEEGIIVALGDQMCSVARFCPIQDMAGILSGRWPLVCVHDEELRRSLIEDGGYSNEEGCWSYSWWKSSIEVPECDFRVLDSSHFDAIMSSYNLADEEDIRRHLEKGDIMGAYVDGQLAGYVGFHSEGSMGMLHVFEEYRRHGLGEALERADIRRALERGTVPYCHVFFSNQASRRLQEKIGLEKGERPVWWLWKD